MVWYGMVWCDVVWCDVVWCGVVHSLVTGMHINRGAGYGLIEFSGYTFLSSVDCGRYREVIFRVGDAFYWLLSLSKGGRCGEVSIRVDVWSIGRDEKSWPLWRGGHIREVAVSRGPPVIQNMLQNYSKVQL